MSRMFYPKLAGSNIRKNGKLYYPYLLASVITVMMFYIMTALTMDEGIDKMPGAGVLRSIMVLGCVIIALFAAIFLFYTNSFLMKRRKKEIGLYNILGMEKKHIGKVLFFETIYTTAIGVVGGLVSGFILYDLVLLLLYYMVGLKAKFSFQLSVNGIVITAALFLGIYLLILCFNLLQIKLSKPVELLAGGNTGEKEPKSKWLITLIGIVCLGMGYYIAIKTKSPLDAVSLFFVAVVLVIIGTYCLFTSGIIIVLKMLRKHKKYYYTTRHFISVSGMIYRMKQNAVGLSNICILATMVLVVISSTVSLYLGMEDAMSARYQSDIGINISSEKQSEEKREQLLEKIKKTVSDTGLKVKGLREYESFNIAAVSGENKISIMEEGNRYSHSGVSMLIVVTAKEYANATGKKEPVLGEDEVYLYQEGVKSEGKMEILGQSFTIEKEVGDFLKDGKINAMMMKKAILVVKDFAVMEELYQYQKEAYKRDYSRYSYNIGINLNGSDKEKITCAENLNKLAGEQNGSDYNMAFVESKQENKAEIYVMYGGFLFLGIFVGLLFLMVTAMIIYYKQISEGYEDRERFQIMLKVGMSQEEVRRCIRSQIIKVFFLPVTVASIHILAAFPMLTRLLRAFNLDNIPLMAACTVITVIAFLLVYCGMYLLTARTYYRIVRGE